MDVSSPTITVITVAFNVARTIERAIESVLTQTYAPLEYVIVDGGSIDGTVEILRRYEHRITAWISEPDFGVADAFNKGIAMASGAYVLFVNADDWIEPNHVAEAVELLDTHPHMAFVYGDLMVHINGRPAYLCTGSQAYHRTFGYRMGELNHPTMVCRRELFGTVGLFDTSYRVAMDFDWLKRLHKLGYRGLYTSTIRGNMAHGGASISNAALGLSENRIAAISAGGTPVACWIMYLTYAGRLLARRGLERWLPHHMIARLRQILFGSVAIVDEDRALGERRG